MLTPRRTKMTSLYTTSRFLIDSNVFPRVRVLVAKLTCDVGHLARLGSHCYRFVASCSSPFAQIGWGEEIHLMVQKNWGPNLNSWTLSATVWP